MLHRRVALARVHVVQHEVAMRERAALGVLAGQADRDAVGQQRAEGERLGVAPVDAALADRAARRRSSCGPSLGCTVKPSGKSSSASESAISSSPVGACAST